MPCEAFLRTAAAEGGPWRRSTPTRESMDGNYDVRTVDDWLTLSIL